jgi:hypothetical protein
MGVGGQYHAPAALPPGKRPISHFTGGWVGSRAGLDGCGKSRPHRDLIPGPARTVASRYTDYALPAHSNSSSNVSYYNRVMSCGIELGA